MPASSFLLLQEYKTWMSEDFLVWGNVMQMEIWWYAQLSAAKTKRKTMKKQKNKIDMIRKKKTKTKTKIKKLQKYTRS